MNKCVAFGCKSGYDDTKGESREKVATFHFPLSNPEILNDWIHFVNRKDWTPTSSSVKKDLSPEVKDANCNGN